MAVQLDYRAIPATFNIDAETTTFLNFFRTVCLRSKAVQESRSSADSSRAAFLSDFKTLTTVEYKYNGADRTLLSVVEDSIKALVDPNQPAVFVDILNKYIDSRIEGRMYTTRYIEGFSSTMRVEAPLGGNANIGCNGATVRIEMPAGSRLVIDCRKNEHVSVSSGNLFTFNNVQTRYATLSRRFTYNIDCPNANTLLIKSTVPIIVDSDRDMDLAKDGYKLFANNGKFSAASTVFGSLDEYVSNVLGLADVPDLPGITYAAFEAYSRLHSVLG
jgi:hypothetical protein